MASVREIALEPRGDSRGKLIPLEAGGAEVPFDVKRVYYIFDTTPGTVRGKHAHHKNRQMLICVSGSCVISCEMPDGTKSDHLLNWPDKGLLVEGMVWHEMKEFSKDAILLVLASEHYDEGDYIRDYGQFKKISGR